MKEKKKNQIFIISSCVIAVLVIAMVIGIIPHMQLKGNSNTNNNNSGNVYQDEERLGEKQRKCVSADEDTIRHERCGQYGTSCPSNATSCNSLAQDGMDGMYEYCTEEENTRYYCADSEYYLSGHQCCRDVNYCYKATQLPLGGVTCQKVEADECTGNNYSTLAECNSSAKECWGIYNNTCVSTVVLVPTCPTSYPYSDVNACKGNLVNCDVNYEPDGNGYCKPCEKGYISAGGISKCEKDPNVLECDVNEEPDGNGGCRPCKEGYESSGGQSACQCASGYHSYNGGCVKDFNCYNSSSVCSEVTMHIGDSCSTAGGGSYDDKDVCKSHLKNTDAKC